MKAMTRVAAAAASVFLATSGLAFFAAPQAQAADQVMTVSPAGPYKGGQVVVVTVTGFSPSAPVAIGVCQTGRVSTGPGDCAPQKSGGSRLLQADATGKASGKITVLQGPIGNATKPAVTCGPSNSCDFSAANITNAKETVQKKIQYVGSAVATKKATTAATTATDTTAGKDTLVQTGSGQTTFLLALGGLAIFQIGLIFAVRAVRSAPRRFTA